MATTTSTTAASTTTSATASIIKTLGSGSGLDSASIVAQLVQAQFATKNQQLSDQADALTASISGTCAERRLSRIEYRSVCNERTGVRPLSIRRVAHRSASTIRAIEAPGRKIFRPRGPKGRGRPAHLPPQTVPARFAIGTPTVLPYSVQEPS